MRWLYGPLCAVLMLSCTKSDSITCTDGTVCPSGTVCLERTDEPDRCVLADQTSVCGTLEDGAYCEGKGFVGICQDQTCLPGCGDGHQDDGEQCDDKNFASHDGCSSRCLSEAPTWDEFHGAWKGRTLHASAYDAASGKLVIFGGLTPGGQDGATWIYDAQGMHVLEGSGPPGLSGASMVFDSNRNVFVLFGGNGIDGAGTNETWELANGQWHKASPTASPPRRTLAGMAFDSTRKKTLLFGGTPDVSPIVELGDTWEYNGTTWTQLTTPVTLVDRFAPAMVYDSFRKQTVMFGGRKGAVRLSETWAFSSTTGVWTELTNATKPPGRERTAMTFVPVRNTIVMFGGQRGGQNVVNDTWEFDGTNWSQLTLNVQPPARDEHVLAFVNNKVTLIGGEATELYDDVWTLDITNPDPNESSQWRNVDLGFAPRARTTPLAYDPDAGNVVIYAGAPITLQGQSDVWTFGPRGWTRLADLAPRGSHGLAYDSAGHRLITVAGQVTSTTLATTTDVWTGSAWTTIAPSPLQARNVAFAFDDAGVGLLFGGEDPFGTTERVFGDTWELTGSIWTKTVAEGGPADASPGPAESAALIYDPTRGAFLVVASDGKTWSYANHAWSPLPTFNSPPPREGEQLIYDSVRGRVVMLGGYDSNTFYTNDLWQLDRLPSGLDVWHLLHVVGEPPPPRRETRAAYSQRLRAIVMFGSNDPTRLADTWLLRFASSTPDEDCHDGKDNDGDQQIDTTDPDCQ